MTNRRVLGARVWYLVAELKERFVDKSFQTDSFSDADLKRRREQIRRGLTRANTAAAGILVIVIGLSLAALFQALRAERNASAAEEASARARDELWQGQIARAP